MNIKQVFAALTRFERSLWFGSLVLIVVSFLLSGKPDFWVLTASLIGATALILLARGEPMGQLLSVVFALLYGYISLRFRYYGEMITYLGMTAPMALASLISWLRHPFEQGKSQVQVSRVPLARFLLLAGITGMVTWAFYYILKFFDTPNLALSTVSIATSFLAVGLTYLRSPAYALAYAVNDVVLIGLWVLAGARDPSCIPMIACFVIFLMNDIYGYYSWRRLAVLQQGMEEI